MKRTLLLLALMFGTACGSESSPCESSDVIEDSGEEATDTRASCEVSSPVRDAVELGVVVGFGMVLGAAGYCL